MCQKNHREVRKNNPVEDPPGTFGQNPLLPPARIAAFCTGNFTEIKKLGRWGAPESDLILDVLAARKPDWVGQFVEYRLGRSYHWNSWRLCREFIRRGLCQKPNNPRYYTGMITGLVGRWNRGNRTALSELKKELLSIESSFDPREVIESAIAHRIDRLKDWAKRKYQRKARSPARSASE